jgi:hypothetical protein
VLHDAASDRPGRYAPVCSHSAVPVCLHPAYRSFLPAVTAALGPVLDQVAGLPGAPVRVSQVAVTSVQQQASNDVALGGPVSSGRPPVLYLPLAGLSLPGEGNTTTAQFADQLRSQDAPSILNALVGLSDQEGLIGGVGPQGAGVSVPQPGPGKATQLAVAAALARVAGLMFSGLPPGSRTPPGNGGTPAGNGSSSAAARQLAAARRFAEFPAAARHAWLVAHLAALRAGRVTLSEIP